MRGVVQMRWMTPVPSTLSVNAVTGVAPWNAVIEPGSVAGSIGATGVIEKSSAGSTLVLARRSGSVLKENALTSPGVQSAAVDPSAGAPPGGAQTRMSD